MGGNFVLRSSPFDVMQDGSWIQVRKKGGCAMSAEQVHEGLKTFVSDLKAVREAKGLSLKDVHEKTKISVSVLDALEKGEFHLLPPDVYTRNFVRNYADFLQVDSQPFLDYFKHESEQAPPPILQKEFTGTFPSGQQRSWKRLALIVSVLFFIGALAWLFASYTNEIRILPDSGSGKLEGTASPEEEPAGTAAIKGVATPPVPAEPLPAAPDAIQPQAAPAEQAQTPPLQEAGEHTSNSYTLIIEAKEKTWLRIRTDGQETTERTLRPGERLDLSAKDRFALDIGNAAGVRVLFQDRLLENLGGHGQVVHLNLP